MNKQKNNSKTYKDTELLAPAGNMEKLLTALRYGANAVYLGGKSYNLRAAANGFSLEYLKKGISEARKFNAKVFYTLNAMPRGRDILDLPQIIEDVANLGIDAFIIADPGVLRLAKRYAPNIPIHLSTQANTTNSESIGFWIDQGVERANLARELNCQEINFIRKAYPNFELEVFVHGAMCLAISGQCLLSAWLNKRHANLGECTQPCRFEYKTLDAKNITTCSNINEQSMLSVAERKRPDTKVWEVTKEEDYSSFWSPFDLCLLPYLTWFIKNQIDSLKIEGRMKGVGYVAHVVDAYATAINNAHNCILNEEYFNYEDYIKEVCKTASRTLSTGFFIPNDRKIISSDIKPRELYAYVSEEIDSSKGIWKVAGRGKWDSKKEIELMLPGLKRPHISSNKYRLENKSGERIDVLNSGIEAYLHLEEPHLKGQNLSTNILIRSVTSN